MSYTSQIIDTLNLDCSVNMEWITQDESNEVIKSVQRLHEFIQKEFGKFDNEQMPCHLVLGYLEYIVVQTKAMSLGIHYHENNMIQKFQDEMKGDLQKTLANRLEITKRIQPNEESDA